MRVTLKPTGPDEAIIVVSLGSGQRLTLPVQLIADAPAGVWSDGRLEHVIEPSEALSLAASTEQEFAAALRS